jgi:hypothetical protein
LQGHDERRRAGRSFMKIKKSPLSNNLWMPVLAIFAVLFIIFANRLGNVGIGEQIRLLLSQIAFVLIPGMAIVLLINPPEDKLILVITSYLAGYALNIAFFFIFSAFGLAEQLIICMIPIAALSVFYIIKKRDLLIRMKTNHSGIWTLLILLILFLTFILFQSVANYNTPDFTGNNAAYIYQDLAWNTGNATAISNGLPIRDIHVEGLSLGYHYFVNTFAAMYKNILGVSSYLMYMKFMPVIQAFVFLGGFYLLFSTLTKNKWKLLFMIGTGIICSLLVLVHMFWFSYATAFGMGLMLAGAYYLLRFIRKIDTAKFFDRDFLLFLILLAAATGSKIMYAAPCLAGFTILSVIQIIRRRNTKNVFLSLVLMLSTFGAVYLSTSFGINGFNHFEFGFAQLIWEKPVYLALHARYPGIYQGLLQLVAYAAYTIQYFFSLVAAVFILIVWLIRSKGREYHLKVFLLSAILCSYTAATILVQNGLSQLMFLNAAMPFCVYTIFYAGNSIQKSTAKKRNKILYGLLILYIFVFGMADGVSSLYAQANQSVMLRSDVSGVSADNVIYKDEYEGMMWLKENTDKDAVFAADRQYISDIRDDLHARYFNYTAISERQCYLEGYEYVYTYNKEFYSIIKDRIAILENVYNNNPKAVQRLRDDGVDYLVCSEKVNPDFILNEQFGTLVFENEGIMIYKLK